MEIRILRQSDERAGFRSGDADLDGFLEKYAGQNQFRHHVGTTYVAVEEGRILGYATVAPGDIEIDELPERLRRKLPTSTPPASAQGSLALETSVALRECGGFRFSRQDSTVVDGRVEKAMRRGRAHVG